MTSPCQGWRRTAAPPAANLGLASRGSPLASRCGVCHIMTPARPGFPCAGSRCRPHAGPDGAPSRLRVSSISASQRTLSNRARGLASGRPFALSDFPRSPDLNTCCKPAGCLARRSRFRLAHGGGQTSRLSPRRSVPVWQLQEFCLRRHGLRRKPATWRCAGGRGGIRTHGGLAPTAVFKTAALNHSATLPAMVQCNRGCRFARGP